MGCIVIVDEDRSITRIMSIQFVIMRLIGFSSVTNINLFDPLVLVHARKVRR